MKKIFILLALLLVITESVQADVNHKYDYCEGTLPSGGFSDQKQTYTVRASADRALVIHLNGSLTDYIFDSGFTGDQLQRRYFARRRFQNEHYAELSINFPAGNDSFCPAELKTNISGTEKSYLLGCFIDRVDFPAPGNPAPCRPGRCR